MVSSEILRTTGLVIEADWNVDNLPRLLQLLGFLRGLSFMFERLDREIETLKNAKGQENE